MTECHFLPKSTVLPVFIQTDLQDEKKKLAYIIYPHLSKKKTNKHKQYLQVYM